MIQKEKNLNQEETNWSKIGSKISGNATILFHKFLKMKYLSKKFFDFLNRITNRFEFKI